MSYETSRHVSVGRIAAELGISPSYAAKLLRLHADWLRPAKITKGRATYYEAEIIEVLRGLLGQDHRSLTPAEKDWLSTYLKGKKHA